MNATSPEHPAVQKELKDSRAAVLRALCPEGFAGQRILDLGCGRGDFLQLLIDQGAEAAVIEGLDQDAEKVMVARARFPEAQFRCGRIEELDALAGRFDLVVLSQVMSQVTDPEDRRQVLSVAAASLRSQGQILVHDMLRMRPRSLRRGFRRFGPEDLARGLPSAVQVRAFRRCTLYPPLMRLVAPRAPALARSLARFPALLGHWMALLQVESQP